MHRAVDCGCRRPPRAEPGHPRFRGLPWGDGRVRRRLFDAPTEEAARLTEGLLRARSWGIHGVGQARGAHGPNRLHLVYSWRIPGSARAPRSDRLEPGATRTGRPGRSGRRRAAP